MSITEKIASKHLGKKSTEILEYSPDLLVAIPRDDNRQQYNIISDNLEFVGWDIWHAYEFSVMTENGLPVTKLIKIKYSCESEFLVESKSLKLYFNSFNLTKIGKDIKDCLSQCKVIIEKDLSTVLKTQVEINYIEQDNRTNIFENFNNIIDFIDESNIKIDCYKENPSVLKVEENNDIKEYYLRFDSLRSNCRVTHQPDFGDLFLYYKSKKHLVEENLVKYLCSFRSEYHFHEECCEMIFKRLRDLLDVDDELFVCALYTRRGGIDICPARWTNNCSFKGYEPLIETRIFARNGVKQ